MKLLTPEQVKTEKEKGDGERRQRIAKLNQEESDAVRRLNNLREQEKSERNRIELSAAERDTAAKVKKTELEVEVEVLERRKADAMRPIEEKRKEADAVLAEAHQVLDHAKKYKSELDIERDSLIEKAEAVADMKSENDEKKDELDRREAGIKSAETEIERSTKSLGEKWVDYHTASTKLIASQNAVERREKEVADAKNANDAVRESNLKESQRLTQERRAIHDAYIALEQAKKHISHD